MSAENFIISWYQWHIYLLFQVSFGRMTFQNHTDSDGQLAARCFYSDLAGWNKALSTDHTWSHCSLLAHHTYSTLCPPQDELFSLLKKIILPMVPFFWSKLLSPCLVLPSFVEKRSYVCHKGSNSCTTSCHGIARRRKVTSKLYCMW